MGSQRPFRRWHHFAFASQQSEMRSQDNDPHEKQATLRALPAATRLSRTYPGRTAARLAETGR